MDSNIRPFHELTYFQVNLGGVKRQLAVGQNHMTSLTQVADDIFAFLTAISGHCCKIDRLRTFFWGGGGGCSSIAAVGLFQDFTNLIGQIVDAAEIVLPGLFSKGLVVLDNLA